MMIGIVMCCHGSMGEGVRDAAEMIAGPQERLAVVGVKPGDGAQAIHDALSAAIGMVDGGLGILLLTDMFGGTPTNVGCTLLHHGKVEVVTGFNLPLLLKALTARAQIVDVSELASVATDYGRRHISVAGELLRGDRE
jgi:mannose PTS system EIIA component